MCTASAAQYILSIYLNLNEKCMKRTNPTRISSYLNGAGAGTWTRDLFLTKEVLYHWATQAFPAFFLQDFNRFAAAEFLLTKTLFRQTDYKGSNKLSIQQQFGTKIVHRFFICSLFSAVFCPFYLPLQRINACIHSFFKWCGRFFGK